MMCKIIPLKYIFITVFTFLNSLSCLAQYDTIQYLPPLYISLGSTGSDANSKDHYLVLSTLETTSFNVTIRDGGNTLFTDYAVERGTEVSPGVFRIAQTSPLKLKFNGKRDAVQNLITRDSLNTKLTTEGFILTAPQNFFANIRHLSNNHGGALTLKGNAGLGTEFLPGFGYQVNSFYNEHFMSNFISVMATEDNTEITFDNFKENVTFFGVPFNTTPTITQPITINLNAGESYVIAQDKNLMNFPTSESYNDYHGTRVTADKKIAVNSGSWNFGSLAYSEARDIGIDQMIPIPLAGTDYGVVKGRGEGTYEDLEKLILVSTVSGSTTVNFGTGQSLTLNGVGDYTIVGGSSYYSSVPNSTVGNDHKNLSIQSSEPIMVYQSLQGANSHSTGSMNVIPPLTSCIGSDSILVAEVRQFNLSGNTPPSAVSIISPTSSTVYVKYMVGGILLTIPPSTENFAGSLLSNYRTNVYEIPLGTANILVYSDERFTLGFLGASGVAGGSGFMSAFSTRQIDFNDNKALFINGGVSKLDLCEVNPAILNVNDVTDLTDFQWYRNDQVIANGNSSSIAVNQAGEYHLEVEYCGLDLSSAKINTDFYGSPGEVGFDKIINLFETDGMNATTSLSNWYDNGKRYNNMSSSSGNIEMSRVSGEMINYHPKLIFSANDQDELKASNSNMGINNTRDFSFFMVLKNTNVNQNSTLFCLGESEDSPRLNKTPSGYQFYQKNGNILELNARVNENPEGVVLVSGVYTPTGMQLSVNGKKGEAYYYWATLKNIGLLTLGNSETGTSSNFDGEIVSLSMFQERFTDLERQKIESYYAMKYGITLDPFDDDQNMEDGDYVNADGNVVWDYSENTAFHHDIVVIGEDDCGRLEQKQSHPNSITSRISISKGAIMPSNEENTSTFSSNQSFLALGHNNEVFSARSVNDFGFTTNLEQILGRIARTWKVQAMNYTDDVRVTFDLSTLSNGTNPVGSNNLSQARLLQNQTDVFAIGSKSISPSFIDNTNNTVAFDVNFNSSDGMFFSLGTMDLNQTALPIQLMGFTANFKEEKNSVYIDWTIASQTNIDYFEIERSTDLKNWVTIQKIIGEKNSSVYKRYQVVDPHPKNGKSYYRLKEVDNNGEKNVYEPQSVQVKYLTPLFSCYPNPSQGVLSIDVAKRIDKGVFRLYDITGKTVFSTVLNASSKVLDVTELMAGVYILEFIANNEKYTQRVVLTE